MHPINHKKPFPKSGEGFRFTPSDRMIRTYKILLEELPKQPTYTFEPQGDGQLTLIGPK